VYPPDGMNSGDVDESRVRSVEVHGRGFEILETLCARIVDEGSEFQTTAAQPPMMLLAAVLMRGNHTRRPYRFILSDGERLWEIERSTGSVAARNTSSSNANAILGTTTGILLSLMREGRAKT